MSLQELVGDRIIIDTATNWQDAFTKVTQPLIKDGYVKSDYSADIINVVNEFGSYIMFAPGFCVPHAKNNGNIIKTGMSILALENSNILLPEKENKVEVLLCLAAVDQSQHISALQDIAKILQDSDSLQKWLVTKDIDAIKKLLSTLV